MSIQGLRVEASLLIPPGRYFCDTQNHRILVHPETLPDFERRLCEMFDDQDGERSFPA